MEDFLLIAAEVGVVVGAGLLAIKFYNVRHWGQCSFCGSLKGKTFIVTGPTSGIGKATAQELSCLGARVILAARDEEKAKQTIDEIKQRTPDAEVVYKHLDLESLTSIAKFAADVIDSEKNLDVLICNAGIFGPPFNLTKDGFETSVQVNHLGHALLELLLLPKLKSSKDPRIVAVTSSLALKSKRIRVEDFEPYAISIHGYRDKDSYSMTKNYALLFHQELAKKLRNKANPVKVLQASPGMVRTNLHRHQPISWWQWILLAPFAFAFVRSPLQGCQTVLECALSPRLSSASYSGKTFRNCQVSNRFYVPAMKVVRGQVFDLTIKALMSANALPKNWLLE